MSITNPSPNKPTVVLVHGAFAESSSWAGVVGLLLDDGFPVIAVANPLRGVRTDAEYLRAVLHDVTGDIVLVGHSYGGTVITNAATGNSAVKALVYVGGFAPDEGESAAQLAGRYEGGTLGDTLTAVALPDGTNDLYIVQDGPEVVGVRADAAERVRDRDHRETVVEQEPDDAGPARGLGERAVHEHDRGPVRGGIRDAHGGSLR